MELIVDIQKKLPGFTLKVAFHTNKEPLGILGASGSGKSMTLRCIAGLETPTKGRIVLNGRTLFDSEKNINLPSQKRKVGFLFQNYALFPHMTVMQNIIFPLNKSSRAEKLRKAEKKIAMMQLEGLEERYPYQLSGGQQQRVALARALAVEPEALLLDEPFSALDNHLRSQMEKQLLETLSDYTGATLFVTHNMDEAYRVCNRLAIFSEGKIVAAGDKDAVFSRPPTLAAAQLTGCKNISEAQRNRDGLIEAEAWGCKLAADCDVSAKLTHVGIRAHYLEMVKDLNTPNTFECRVADIGETPFEVTVYLSLLNPSHRSAKHLLQWKIAKEKWLEIKDKAQPWYIQLPPEKIFMIAEE